MIPIYIASAPEFSVCEPVIRCSIEANTRAATAINIIRPDVLGVARTGCTGFTNLRFAVPELLRRDGHPFGIYFDVDMVVLGDVAELFAYRVEGEYVCMADGSTEVGVVSADINMPLLPGLCRANKRRLDQLLPKRPAIPHSWNVEDRFDPAANLIHFTDLKKQPWFYDDHPDQAAVDVWRQYADLAKSV